MEVVTQSARETQKLGQEFGTRLKGGETLALVGDLGAGKTTFIQGLAKGLGVKQRIISPTFILMRNYGRFYHLDLYRLETEIEKEVENLGIREIWNNPTNIVVIEWAEKIRDHLPRDTVWIDFENKGGDRRRITIK